MATSENAIDIAAVLRKYAKYPRGSAPQFLGVLMDLHQHDPTAVSRFFVERWIARGGGILTRPTPQPTAENLTREEWRRLLEMFGVDGADVRDALWALGFGI